MIYIWFYGSHSNVRKIKKPYFYLLFPTVTNNAFENLNL